MGLTYNAKAKSLAITSLFEGMLAGNFDGQYLSYGYLQWNFGQGTLQPLFKRLFNEYPEVASNLLPNGGMDLKNALDNGTERDWALSIQSRNYVQDPWRSALQQLYYTKEFIDIMNAAAQWYIDRAINMCVSFNMTKEQDFALAFDLAVQNGGLNYYEMLETSEYDKRVSWVEVAVAKTTGRINGSVELCKQDVRNRKMAIVTGGTYGTKSLPDGLVFDDVSMFEEEKKEEPKWEDWRTILTKISNNYELWESGIITIGKLSDAANIGCLNIGTYIPALIEKIFNRRSGIEKPFDTLIDEYTTSPNDWKIFGNTMVNMAELEGDMGDLEVFKYFKKLIEKINSYEV